MTARPLPQYVAEDVGEVSLELLSIDSLVRLRDVASEEIKAIAVQRGAYEAELRRRILEDRPDYNEESGGSAEIAGEDVLVRMTYKREYAWREDVLAEIQPLIKPEEWDKFVKIEMKGNGTTYNQLMKRGGALADILQRARILKSATPQLEVVKR